ncbi:restriction endonuclease subunit S [Candidatus Gracilibacteria bacterium]|nr:restriction endonuclease subunit S [Candidatus Gracilibacteria bacterium]NJM86122.1 restriction endonuclease subunit S [Hydrococcus sp. RU_2_2]NJP20472.1 restriction endonuclease subunit S [Hydrococcus sp. CRU_1_1]NJQ96553.1 restriction endonuclease subunit S [Hydrococcus sp. CSU_1_8]
MPIPPLIQNLIDRLNFELIEIDNKATEGLNRVNALLSRFPDNAILIQYLAFFNTAQFFRATSLQQLQAITETLSLPDNTEIIVAAGEDLGTLLGKVLEVKLKLERLMTRLEE